MTDHAFNRAQAAYDTALPDDEELPEPEPIRDILEGVLQAACDGRVTESVEVVHDLTDRQATAALWIDGHEYSLTLNREDG